MEFKLNVFQTKNRMRPRFTQTCAYACLQNLHLSKYIKISSHIYKLINSITQIYLARIFATFCRLYEQQVMHKHLGKNLQNLLIWEKGMTSWLTKSALFKLNGKLNITSGSFSEIKVMT